MTRPSSPLLVTQCYGCYRRRAGVPMPFYHWLCRQCIERVIKHGRLALKAFKR